MAAYLSEEFHRSWNRLLQDAELATNYAATYQLNLSAPVPNPLLGALLPSSLYLRLISLLDEALAEYIDLKELKMPAKHKQDLYHRIKFLSENNLLTNANDLQELREKRKLLAHDANRNATWQELAKAFDITEQALQHLVFVGARPGYEFYAEKCPAKESTNPGGAFSFDYSHSLKTKVDRKLSR